MAHWATSPLDREQFTLFAPTLDQTIAPDHPVRLFAETLAVLDFADWESMYVRVVGQPPIHPRLLAGCILYGLSLGIRSSRRLEDAAANRLDFIWLLEGRVPDHSTLCNFRTQFGPQLKGLFRQVGRVAIELGLIALNRITLDGTVLAANNSRLATNRRASLQQKLDEMDRQVQQLLEEADAQDQAEDQLFGESSPNKLPKTLRDLRTRQDRLRAAMENLTKLEQDRKARGDGKDAAWGPAIPTTDPDSRVLPGKQGGYAPAYTAVLANDAEHGMILDAQVIIGNDEASTVLAAIGRIEQSFGCKPDEMIADSGFNTGANLAGLAEQEIQPLMPPRQEIDASAALRADPSQPIAEKDQTRLPINPQNKVLDRSAFVYDAQQDRYHCPMGRVLERTADKPYNRHGRKGIYQVYQSVECGGCRLASRCLTGRSPVRRLCRDEHEPLREEMAKRMQSPAGSETYRRRAWIAETAFAMIKAKLNIRQLLLRGLRKVQIEMDWAATAFNLMKLMRLSRG